jgi:FAD/FMN-containing dehydrogenase
VSLLDDLRAAVGDGHVLVDADVRAGFERDWTNSFGVPALAVVRPGSTEEVAAVIAACRAAGAPIVPQGGNTGLVGGGVPSRPGEVVLSLTRLKEIGEIDRATGQVTVGAGVTLAALAAAATAAGLDSGFDLASRDSATVGGAVSCDGGGARALRHGTARHRVAGLEAVLGDGTVVRRLAGLLKDNAGLALPALLVGSEGTLGVITRVRWRLVPVLPARVTAWVPLDSIEAAAALLAELRAGVPSLEAVDFVLPDALALARAHYAMESPVRDAAIHLIVEAAAGSDPTDELAAVLPDDAAVADDTAGRARLWKLREGLGEAIEAGGVSHKLDVGVPLARLTEFLERLPAAIEAASPGARPILFGHLGDGNVHVNVLDVERDDGTLEAAILRLTADLGGTISAEHGVGTVKARFLGLVRSPDEIAAMRRIKATLDPDGILNPGVILAPADENGDLDLRST